MSANQPIKGKSTTPFIQNKQKSDQVKKLLLNRAEQEKQTQLK